jgi:hypothetical protein
MRKSLVLLVPALLMLAMPVQALLPGLPALPSAPGVEDVYKMAPKVGGPFNGVGSYAPAGSYDAPIFRQFAFVEGQLTQYHVLTPETFLMDHHQSHIYQFPACQALQPVLEKHHPVPGDGGYWGEHDAPTRQIVDVVLSTGCSVQPKSVDEVNALALQKVERTGFVVNAPILPPQVADWPDAKLFSGPPFRPRVSAWQDGQPVKFITYEASWYPQWAGNKWPNGAGDVFMISYGAVFRPGFTILNFASGTPENPLTMDKYSPIWRANCVVDADNPKCMVSVNQREQPYQPDTGRGYFQCRSTAECLNMVNYNGHRVELRGAPTFTHINCPMVAVDLDLNDYISANEDIMFPDLWVDGPVIV